MSFLRFGALWALPLVLIPIVIHLIHRRRHPTRPWAAMMFLRRAAQSRRGPAKLRRWLILATRTLVVAAIVFALARPLSSGMFGVAASRVVSDATSIVVVDRSPSMQRRTESGMTRQAATLDRVAETLRTLQAQHVVLVDSAGGTAIELDDVRALTDPAVTGGVDSTADLPRLLRTALQYLQENDHRVADIWVCSDLGEDDWRPESPQWKQVAEAVDRLGDGVRLNLLAYGDDSQSNSSVAVTRCRLSDSGQGSELAISVSGNCDDAARSGMPVRITVDGVTSTFDLPLDRGRGQVIDARIAVSPTQGPVFGQVAIDADVNAADDRWFFVAAADQSRPIGLRTEATCLSIEVAAEVLGSVVDDDSQSGAGESSGPESSGPESSGPESSGPGQGGLGDNVDGLLDSVACVLWQGQLPSGVEAAAVTKFLSRGGSVVFFPPQQVDRSIEFQGVRWGQWTRGGIRQATFDQWELPIDASCSIEGELVRLARVGDQELLIGKIRVGEGNAWFCGADVVDTDNLFVKDGLVLYGVLKESLDASLLHTADDGGFTAGRVDERLSAGGQAQETSIETLIARGDSGETVDFGHHAGVFAVRQSVDSAPRIVAINRSESETITPPLSEQQLHDLVPQAKWNVVMLGGRQDQSDRGIVREVWGVVWVMMIAGMLCEAWLSLPGRARGGSQ